MEKKVTISRILPAPKYVASPIISIPHQSGTFVTTDEPAVTHHYDLKSIVYIRVQSLCCTF